MNSQPTKNWASERAWIKKLSNKLRRLLDNPKRDKMWQSTVEDVIAQMELRIEHLSRPTPND